MIDPSAVLSALSRSGVDFFTGVPDSLLKEFNACLAAEVAPDHHVVAPNEGSAVAVAAGHFMATGGIGLVYLQNSGLGNAVNPLVSLTSPHVYGIPMLLMIGWRGEPGLPDEPQHRHQGAVTEETLALLEVPVYRLTPDTDDWMELLEDAVEVARSRARPTALLISAGTFGKYQQGPKNDVRPDLALRSDALSAILDTLPASTFYVATTGYTARELAALRIQRAEVASRDLLVVGSMGHASSIALGMALARPDLPVVCLDGDGSLGMHLGVMAMIGLRQPPNLGHILINNEVHESVGGQPSAFRAADAAAIALACGYRSLGSCERLSDLVTRLKSAAEESGPWFVEVKVRQGTLTDLPRPEDFVARLERLRSAFEG
jgi:phosphonopyruvate decarboxylase